MTLSGLHLLLTYKCNFECDHCFVWGSPQQDDTMTLRQIRSILDQAGELESMEWIYFEGGEPFLYYAPLVRAVRMAFERGFRVGIVTNAYWATDVEDALEYLRPLGGLVQDLSISNDTFHGGEENQPYARNARDAAERLAIPAGTICIAEPDNPDAPSVSGQIPPGEYAVRFRGRAAARLAGPVARHPWRQFTDCPFEDLRDPGRVHVDALGYLHICQGISIGNLFETPLKQLCESYDPDAHPVVGPLLAGGPAELARRFDIVVGETYADACHLCYRTRRALRSRLPALLVPDAMYGVGLTES